MSFKPRPARGRPRAAHHEPDLRGFKKPRRRRISSVKTSNAKKKLEKLGKEVTEAINEASTRIKARYRIHANKDGTIDAEISIPDLPRGMSAEDALMELWENLPDKVPGTFVSFGLKHTDAEGESSADRRYRGLYWVQTNYQDASNETKMIDNVLRAQKQLVANLRRKRRRKPRDVFVRFHWNNGGKRPDR